MFEKQKNCICQIVNQKDGKTDMPLAIEESKSVVKIKPPEEKKEQIIEEKKEQP